MKYDKNSVIRSKKDVKGLLNFLEAMLNNKDISIVRRSNARIIYSNQRDEDIYWSPLVYEDAYIKTFFSNFRKTLKKKGFVWDSELGKALGEKENSDFSTWRRKN